jgi:hypothetical protein
VPTLRVNVGKELETNPFQLRSTHQSSENILHAKKHGIEIMAAIQRLDISSYRIFTTITLAPIKDIEMKGRKSYFLLSQKCAGSLSGSMFITLVTFKV